MDDKVRLIDAELLRTNIAQIAKNCARSDAQKALIGRILFMIEHMPTIEAEPVQHGRWIPHEDEDGTHNGDNCSECGEWYVMLFRKTNFCPNCGSKNRMDGGNDA